ncbi:MAG: MMPL family transporter [Acidobacteriota bacterium]
MTVGLLLGGLAGTLRLQTDNSPEQFFLAGSPRLAAYQELRAAFGSDRGLRLVVSGDRLWTPEGMAWLLELEEAAQTLPGVEGAAGLASHYRPLLSAWPPEPDELRRRARASTLDRNLGWIDRTGRTATVWVTLSEDAELSPLATLLERDRPAGVDAHLAGSPILDRALDRSSQEIQTQSFPLLLIAACLLLFAVFRDLAGLIVPLTFVAVCELTLLGLMGFTGVRLNLVLAVLPPLLFVISLATAIHVLMRYRAHRRELEHPAAVAATYRDKGWAVFWTGLTTFVGFASLAVSPVAPVRSLGLWSGLGIAVLTLAAFQLLPNLLAIGGSKKGAAPPGQRAFESRTSAWARAMTPRLLAHRGKVLALATALALVALAGLPRLRTESNALTYLAPQHPARTAIEELEAAGIGIASLEVAVHLPNAESASSAPPLARLSTLSDRLRGFDPVLGVVGAGDLVDDFVANSALGTSLGRQGAYTLLAADPRGRQALAPWWQSTTARLLVFAPMAGFDRLEPLLTTIEEAAQSSFPQARIEVTGQYPLLLESQRALLRTLALSFALTFIAVGLVFRLLLGTTRLTILALLPNLWPVIGALGLMGWYGVPVDVATVMVASVVLGLAVDDTLHTLGHFRHLAPRHGTAEAVARTLELTAPSYLLTGLVLAVGFAVCGLSDFAPTARFGGISAFAILLAVIGDLFLLPALLGSTPAGAVRKIRGRLTADP